MRTLKQSATALALTVLALAASLAATPAAADGPVGVASVCASPPPSASPLPVDATPGDLGLALEETRIHWTRWTRKVRYGEVASLAGQVVTDDGAVPSAEVELFARDAGSRSWTRVWSTTSDRDTGVFTFDCLRPDPTTDYRVVHEGTLLHGASEGVRRVRVARRVPDAMRQVAADRFRLTGSVSPEHAAAPVHLQSRGCRSCAWRRVDTDTTSSRSRWGFSIRVGDAVGTRWFRALVPASDGYVASPGDHVWRITAR